MRILSLNLIEDSNNMTPSDCLDRLYQVSTTATDDASPIEILSLKIYC